MYTEKQLQEAIQACILTIDSYSAGDVVINDWTIFDQQVALSPYVIIGNCSSPIINYSAESHQWRIPIILAVSFKKTWKETEDAIRDERQNIVTLFETDPYRGLNVSSDDTAIDIRELVAQTDFLPWYDPALSSDQTKDATPLFLFQEMQMTLENY